MSFPPISIIVPVFNERRGLPPTLERLEGVLAGLASGSEVILVDDGSTDGTERVLEKALKKLPTTFQVVTHPRNRGYGAALKTGIRHASNEIVAITDADGTYPVEEIPGLLSKMMDEDATMVVAARPKSQQPLIRRPAKAILETLAQYLANEKIPDMNSGLRLFPREDGLRLQRLLPDSFSFTTTITMALLTEGARVTYAPIKYNPRMGKSKIKPVRDTANFLLLIIRTAMAFHPMKVFGPVGLMLIVLGVVLLLLRLILPDPVGVATTVTFLVGGLQVFAIGLLADLVNRRGGGV